MPNDGRVSHRAVDMSATGCAVGKDVGGGGVSVMAWLQDQMQQGTGWKNQLAVD